MKRLKLLASSAVAATLLFTGCGSEEDKKAAEEALATYTDEFGNTVTESETSIDGVVADGYLKGAIVCIDTNSNKKCDDDEPQTVTKEGGEYTLKGSDSAFENYPILVEVVAGSTVDEDFPDVKISKPYIMTSPAGKPATGEKKVVTPLTTLVQAKVENEGLTGDAAEILVLQDMGLSYGDVDLMADYIDKYENGDATEAAAYKNMHQVAKVVAEQIANAIKSVQDNNPTIDLTKKMGLIFNSTISDVTDTDNLAALKSAAYASDTDDVNDILTSAASLTDEFAYSEEEAVFFDKQEEVDINDKSFIDMMAGDGAFSLRIEMDDGLNVGYEHISFDYTGGDTTAKTGTVSFRGYYLDETGNWTEKTGGDDSYTYKVIDSTTGDITTVIETESNDPEAVTLNDDGTVTVEGEGGTETVAVAEKFSLNGMTIGTILPDYVPFEFRSVLQSLPIADRTFGAETLAIRLKFKSERDDQPYRIHQYSYENCYWDENGQNICEWIEDGNRLSYWDSATDTHKELTSLDSVTTIYAYTGEDTSGNLKNGNTIHVSFDQESQRGVEGQFNSDGTMVLLYRYWDENIPQDWNSDGVIDEYGADVQEMIPDIGTWKKTTVGTRDVLIVSVPEYLKSGWEKYEERFFVLDDSNASDPIVREGSHELEGEVVEKNENLLLNAAAMTTVKAAIATVAADIGQYFDSTTGEVDWGAMFDTANAQTFPDDFNDVIVVDFGFEQDSDGTEYKSELRIALNVADQNGTFSYERFDAATLQQVEGETGTITYDATTKVIELLQNSTPIGVKFYKVDGGTLFMDSAMPGEDPMQVFVPFFVDFNDAAI